MLSLWKKARRCVALAIAPELKLHLAASEEAAVKRFMDSAVASYGEAVKILQMPFSKPLPRLREDE